MTEPSQVGAAPPAVTVLRIAVGSSNPAKIRAVEHAVRRAVLRATTVAHNSQSSSPERQEAAVQLQIQGFDVPSGAPHQHFGDAETQQGAQNRAQAAYQAYRDRADNESHRAPHLAVGLEGGLEWLNTSSASSNGSSNNDTNHVSNASATTTNTKQDLFCMAWMAVYGKRDSVTVEALASAADTTTYSGDRKPVYGLAKTALFAIPDAVADLVKEGVELGEADDRVFDRVQSKHGSGTVGILTDGLVDRSAYYEHALLLALTPWIRPDLYPDGN